MTERDLGDALAAVSAFGAFTSMLPNIAALFAIVWTTIRIYEWARVVIWKRPKREGLGD